MALPGRRCLCSHTSGHWAGSGGGASSLRLGAVHRTGGVPTPSSRDDGTWALFSLEEREMLDNDINDYGLEKYF